MYIMTAGVSISVPPRCLSLSLSLTPLSVSLSPPLCPCNSTPLPHTHSHTYTHIPIHVFMYLGTKYLFNPWSFKIVAFIEWLVGGFDYPYSYKATCNLGESFADMATVQHFVFYLPFVSFSLDLVY